MNINTERALLIKELEQVEDISLLNAIKALVLYGLKSEGKISIEQYNRELDEANARIEAGNFSTQEDLEKKVLPGEEKVIWDELAKAAFKEAHQYIQKDSPKQAEKVKKEIISATKRLSDNPEMHPPDKYRTDNDERFRAFEKFNYRISYFITKDVIRVLRFRHVKQKPLLY